MKRVFWVCAILGLLVTGVVNWASVLQLIEPGSVWKYNDNGEDLGTAWREISYNDAGWSSGPAQLGYGDGDEASVISFGGNKKNKYPCYYFRYSFDIADPGVYGALTLKVLRDDGCVVYLNSQEVARSNMPSGNITYNTWASSAVGGSSEDVWHEFSVNVALLVTGTNVIAVEVHQNSGRSSDLSFDLELTGSEGPGENEPPEVSGIPDQTIQEGESFSTINLDEYVTDPDNTDEEMTWTYSGNSDLSVDINEVSRVATITAPYPEWTGTETITFTATDPGVLSSSDQAIFTVTVLTQVNIIKGPYLQTVTPNSIVIMWETDVDAGSRVDFGLAAPNQFYSDNNTPVKIHEITIMDNLTADTTYYYTVTSDDVTSATYTFSTAPATVRPFRFVAYGDTRTNYNDHTAVIQAIIGSAPEFVLNTGDLVNNGKYYNEWGPQFFEPAHDLMVNTPMLPILGNHEYWPSQSSQKVWFFDFFSLPNNEEWFAFSYGNARFIGLNTNVDYSPSSDQYYWLMNEFDSPEYTNATWHFVYFHHPPYTNTRSHSDDIGVQTHLVPLFEQYGVDMVFNGHSHAYERYHYNDVYYIVTGGGGAPLATLEYDDTEEPIREVGVREYHYCVLDVFEDHCDFVAKMIDEDETVIDQINLSKDIEPPVITTHPAPQTVDEGQTATFEVVASGSEPLSYQWRKDGVDISGATSSGYTTPPTSLSDDGSQFDVVVTNSLGDATSNAATLTVNQGPPVITTHPVSQTILEGQTATFTVVATSSLPMTYQWRKDDVDISGATSSSYTTPPATVGDDGDQFDVVVTNSEGYATSNAAILTVNPLPPVITIHPVSQTVDEGQTATFTVVATSSVSMTYQWRKDGVDISGATSSSYTTPPATVGDDGAQFDVVVSNSGGSVTSNAATLTVNPLPPVITTHPSDQTVDEGQTATFTVIATSSAPMTYQWRKDGVDISGATSSSYTTPPTSLSDEGGHFNVVVTNSGGSVTSNAATLTVNAIPPVITTHPASQTVDEGQTATFTVVATSSLPMTYQWRKDDVDISGATSSSYTTPPTTVGDDGAQFDVVVSNSAGSVTSNAATLTLTSAEVEVFYDSFEESTWNGKWSEDSQNDWFRSTQRAVDGSYSAEVDGGATDAQLISIPIDLQGRTSATISFSWFIEKGLDTGEYLAFDVSTDGGSNWVEKARLQGNVDTENMWHSVSVDLSGINSLKLRFRGKMNRSNEDADVDVVKVIAR